jgi:replication factor A1
MVDDLFDREEFNQRVEEKIEESGGLLDELTAAMLVVRDAGREHRKIAGLDSASSLTCFFGKVLSTTPKKEFERKDGGVGAVSRLRVGDETGEVTVVLWDEQAEAAGEIEQDEVLEIVGRIKKTPHFEVHAIAMRRTACEISTRGSVSTEGSGKQALLSLDVRLLALGETRAFTRKDGTMGYMTEAVIGDSKGTARLVCWSPDLFRDISVGHSLHIENVRSNLRSQQREYSIGESATLHLINEEISIPFTPLKEIHRHEGYSVRGRISDVKKPRSFTTRRGEPSWVRNAVLTDETGVIGLVIWGEKALLQLDVDDSVEVYNAPAKNGRSGALELHVGFGSAIRLVGGTPEEIEMKGTVMDTAYGKCIDNGERCYLLESDLPPGVEVRVTGLLTGRRLFPKECEFVSIDPKYLDRRIQRFLGDDNKR